MPSKTIEDFAYQVRDYMRSAEVVEGKNHAYSQENNAVIATIENGKSYKVRWTGSATVTLKKNSASGTEVTSGSTSPLSFTADSDFDLYFGSSADVTEIMVYDGASTDDTYEPYYVPVKDRLDKITPNTIYDTLWQGSSAVELDTTDVTEFNLASPYTNYKFIDVLLFDNWGNGSFVTFYGIGRGHKKGLYWAEGINGTNKTAVLSHDYTNDDNAKKLCLKVIIADGSSSFYPQAKSKVTAILGRNI